MIRRALAGAFLLLLLGLAGFLSVSVLGRESLSPGDPFPAVTYRSDGVDRRLEPDPSASTVVVLYQEGCLYCRSEFDQFEAGLERFGNARLYLLTAADSVSTETVSSQWPRLASAPNVQWGSVSVAEFQERFGSLVTPSAYVFGADGRLRQAILGEASVEYISRFLD